MPLKVEHEQPADGVDLIAVIGELDHATAPDLQDAIDRVVAAEGRRVVLDLRDCTFMDSTGLGVIVVAHHRLSGNGSGRLAVCCPTGTVDRLFKLTALDEEIALLGARDEAIESVKAA